MKPLLTIAIPTFQRAAYLEKTLTHLASDFASIEPGLVEIVVSDNASPDETPGVVERAIAGGLPVRYVRNDHNIGSDANIAQVFNLASGSNVLILGDDDILMPGVLERLLTQLAPGGWGVVFLRPYGYDEDITREYPGQAGADQPIADVDRFLVALGPHLTLISSLVINKDLLADIDAHSFVGGNLVQVHLVLMAMSRAGSNLFSSRYSVACKRNNSGGYLFARVFVTELGRILDSYAGPGSFSRRAIARYETKMLVAFHPTYAWRSRRDEAGREETITRFRDRFAHRPLYWIWVAPILILPKPLARPWSLFTIAAGRLIYGDLRRGTAFVRSLMQRRGG